MLRDYDDDMATQDQTEAEVFQSFLAQQVASTGRSKTPEELVRLWRDRQKEQADTLEAIAEGIADIEAGRIYPFEEVNDEIRRKHGWESVETLAKLG
jgi:predicted transcriptional regulator